MQKQKYAVPLTTNFSLVFNVTAIKKWLKNKKEIPPLDFSSWDYDALEEMYKITMLPHDPLVFYHNEVNMFSPGFHGSDRVEGIKLEWAWQNYGIVYKANQRPIFIIPDTEIKHMLKTGESLLEIPHGAAEKGEIIPSPIQDDKHCPRILRKISLSQEINYSNALAYMAVGVLSGNGCIDYSSARD